MKRSRFMLCTLLIFAVCFTLTGCKSLSGNKSVLADTANEVKRTNSRRSTVQTSSRISTSVRHSVTRQGSSQSPDNPFHKLDKMAVRQKTDFAHCSTDTIIQGNGEAFEITVDTYNKNADEDDLILLYDETEFKLLSTDIIETKYSSSPTITYRVQCLKEGYHDLFLLSTYDYYEDPEDPPFYYFEVHKLNQREGMVVWASATGDKYHKTEAHAGSSPIKTTLYDVQALEIDPCRTCYK